MAITTFRIEVIINTDSAEARTVSDDGTPPKTLAQIKLQNDVSWSSVAEGIVSLLNALITNFRKSAAACGQEVRPAVSARKVADA